MLTDMPLPHYTDRETEAQSRTLLDKTWVEVGHEPLWSLLWAPCPTISPSNAWLCSPTSIPPTGWGRPEDPVQRKSDDKRLPGRDNPLLKHACCSNYKGDQIGFKLELIGCPLIHAIYLALTSPSGRVGWKKAESHLLPHCTHIPEGNSCKPPAPNPFKRFKEHRQWDLGAWSPPSLPTSPEEDERGLGGSGRLGRGIAPQRTKPEGSRQALASSEYALECCNGLRDDRSVHKARLTGRLLVQGSLLRVLRLEGLDGEGNEVI